MQEAKFCDLIPQIGPKSASFENRRKGTRSGRFSEEQMGWLVT
jgi:hypothetical protein